MFRLSDSSEDVALSYSRVATAAERREEARDRAAGIRWRVLPAAADRVPGTFDQDVYVELFHRYHDAGSPADGTITFTLHAFLRAMGRRVDGRTYEQLRGALTRLERTVLESAGAYFAADSQSGGRFVDERFTILTALSIDRRRTADRDQLALFPVMASSEPGEARVTLAPLARTNIARGHTTTLSAAQYYALPSPTARRLYRLLSAVRAATAPSTGRPMTWDVALEALAEQLPLSQRYPSHLQRVLEPAHAMLTSVGFVRGATIRQQRRIWVVHYELA